MGALGGIAVCSVQLLISMVVRSFAPPVAVALAGDPAACEAMRKQQAEQINANSAQDIARFVLCENANDD